MKRAHVHAILVLLGVAVAWFITVSAVSARKLEKVLAAPPIASISPTTAVAGGPTFNLTINATGYDSPTVQVFWNSIQLNIVLSDTNSIIVSVPDTLITVGQVATISITDSGGPTPTTQPFTVNNPAPNIGSVVPSSAQAGTLTSLVINGSNFNASTTVQLGANPLPVTSWTSTALNVAVTASLYTTAGSYPLTVTNPAPGGGQASANVTIEPAAPSQLGIARSATSASAGTPIALTAYVSDTFNNPVTTGTVAWANSSGTLAPSGTGARNATFTGSLPGTAFITATLGSAVGTTTLTINPGAPATIAISPNPASTTAGGQVVFTAIVRDAFSNVIPNQAVNWSVSGGVGSIAPSNGPTATLTAATVANSYPNSVFANFPGATAGLASVTINAGPVARLQIAPPTAVMTVATTRSFAVTAFDQYNNVVSSPSVAWTPTANFSPPNATTPNYTAPTLVGTYPITVTSGLVFTTAQVTTLPGPAAIVTLVPATTSAPVNTTRSFTATVTDQYGNALPSVVWSRNPTAGNIESSGPLTATFRTGTTAGTFARAITATGTSGSPAPFDFSGVVVQPGPAFDMTLAPASASLVVSTTRSFTATVVDQYNNVISNPAVTWTVSGTLVGGISPITPGTAIYTAGTTAGVYPAGVRVRTLTTGGLITRTASITLLPGAVTTVTLSPNNTSLTPLGVQVFTAQLRDRFLNPISGGSFTWSTFGTGVITPTAPGAATATFQAGAVAGIYNAAVRASANGFTGVANVVINASAPATIVVTPGSASMQPRQLQTFSARGFDAFNNLIWPLAVNWTVNGTGLVTSTGIATATFEAGTVVGSFPNGVRASTSGVTGTANIVVNPGPLAVIHVSPQLVGLPVNTPQALTANGTDAYDNAIPSLSVTWSATPGAGTFDSVAPTSAVFRTGPTPGAYPAGIQAKSGSVVGQADVIVIAGSVAAVNVTPSAATIGINETQLFEATVTDQFGNAYPELGVLWQLTSPSIGTIVSTGPLTALVRAGTLAGTFVNGLQAANGPVVGAATISVPQGPATDFQMSVDPQTLQTDGLSTATVVVTVIDAYGNPVGAGMPVSLAIDECAGTCSLGTTAANTDSQGQVVTTLRSENRSASAPITSNIKVSASVNGANGPVAKSVSVIGTFTPYRNQLPILNRDFPVNNHTSCTALLLEPPDTVTQAPSHAFNIYRLVAGASSYTVSVNNYATSGQLLLFRIVADNCASNGTMTVTFIGPIVPITAPSTQFVFTNAFAPGAQYLLAVNTTGAGSNQPYTLSIQP